MQDCIKQDLLYFFSHVPSVAHGDKELDFAIKVLYSCVDKFANAIKTDTLIEKLESQIIEPIFRRP